MDTNRIVRLALAAAVAASAAAGVAAAKERSGNEQNAQALLNSKIGLSQAIATAEQHAGGKAVDAGVGNENGTVRIAVEVASTQGVKTVLVDPQTGQVTGTIAGDEDGEEHDN